MIFKQTVPILYSSDVNRSLDYYIEVFGFGNKWAWDEPPTFGGVSKDLVEIFFCKEAQGNPGTWMYVMVDNVDELYERIKTKGGKVLCAPEKMEWGLKEMVAEDPDGHRIRFGQQVRKNDPGNSSSFPENIKIIERIPTVKEYQYLVSSVGWLVKSEAFVEKLLSAPVYGVIAEDSSNGDIIGCVLLLGDHSSFFYIKDMIVEPKWQNKHVGTTLMQYIHNWIESNVPEHALVGLYTGESLAPFYQQFGFKPSFGMCRRITRKEQ